MRSAPHSGFSSAHPPNQRDRLLRDPRLTCVAFGSSTSRTADSLLVPNAPLYATASPAGRSAALGAMSWSPSPAATDSADQLASAAGASIVASGAPVGVATARSRRSDQPCCGSGLSQLRSGSTEAAGRSNCLTILLNQVSGPREDQAHQDIGGVCIRHGRHSRRATALSIPLKPGKSPCFWPRITSSSQHRSMKRCTLAWRWFRRCGTTTCRHPRPKPRVPHYEC